MWSGIYYTLSTTGVQLFLEMFPLQQVYDTGINSFYMGEKENIVYVLQIFKLLIPAYIETLPQCVEPIFTATWKACFDIRKTDLFWKAFDKWIEMVYQECTFGNTNYHSILKSYCNEILNLGNDIFGLTNLLIERFYNMRCAINLSPFAEILHSCLIFGPILRKDQRIEKELCDCIESMGEEMAINVLMPGLNTKYSTDVRIFSLSILLDKDTFERNNLVKILISELLQSYKESCKSNRYFNDSLVHRKRNRILQTLLALNSLIINDVHFHKEVNELLNFVNENLLCESQQPSIRYQLEWLYILLVNNNADDSVTRRNLWASNERLGSVCSFISIAYHLVKLKQDEDFFEEFLENVLPWCMSQNFNIRLYAQVTLKKLLSQYKNVSIKYDILTRNQWKIYQQGNMLNNAQKLETDFYFDCFNPFKHFSLQTIFWDLPRLSNVSSEEWIPLTVLKEKITNKPEKLLWGDEELEDVNSLSERLVPNWILKAHGSNSEYEEQYSVQKKFTPWKGMFPQEIDSDHCSKKKGELILVASLIDKTSNLGGLARTCEVFGAKELIIDSLNFINDKQFTSLSMTAEKHINITEVKSYHLSDYLNNMKKFGYTVVGAEQTTESISLSEYKFNKKTLLILGSEREGIPVNILPFLDACIEIPQYGLIRSLNVHVTGAICLWEYAKQHY
ncbi:hypothetical protein O3M35_007301 [Rhynocoris fuscipes]|uniref:tRNA (guanosine(18)-2'-O)-methyltransferase TARBP1 n=1 Tax=Rhynocoris fuscipes TaxID=488301 RepID=A0AAW1D942_9HEMI